MNINRYNYEEFFLLYVDNELTKAERLEVEAFVDANPDLREELNILNQLKLKPETGIRFNGKELLMKLETDGGMINATNYEEFFVLYVDGELTVAERREVENFAANNPALQLELNLLLQTKIEPEHAIVFPDKSLLYKQPETDRKPVFILWKRVIAVAAMLLVALGIFWISNRPTGNEVAGRVDKKQVDKVKDGKQNEQLAKEDDNAQDQLADKDEKKSTSPSNKPSRRFDVQDNDDKQQLAITNNRQNQDAVIADTDRPLTTTGIASVTNTTAGITISTRIESAHLTSAAQAKGEIVSYASNAVEENYSEDAVGPVGVKKNKLRGLFRKVTRVFEKTTNLPAVEEKGILIGNFEIALK
jgi:hypothetical protein